MSVWTAALLAALTAVAYAERKSLYLLIVAAYVRLTNWKH